MGANEDGVWAVMLGGADGKAYSSSWLLHARSPLSLGKGEDCLLYMYAHIKLRKMACEHRYVKNQIDTYMNMIRDLYF